MIDFIPNTDECMEILKKKGCSNSVIRHSMAVRDVAVSMAKKANADIVLVEAGSLLHDIGRSKTHDISHGVEGAKIAKKMGLSMKLVKIIERHVGAGIPADTAVDLSLPKRTISRLPLKKK